MAKPHGICSITAEQLKCRGDSLVEWIGHIINHAWIHSEVPDNWHKGIILPLWKGKGDHLDCSNYRGIMLLCILGKLFTHILLNQGLMVHLQWVSSTAGWFHANCRPHSSSSTGDWEVQRIMKRLPSVHSLHDPQGSIWLGWSQGAIAHSHDYKCAREDN